MSILKVGGRERTGTFRQEEKPTVPGLRVDAGAAVDRSGSRFPESLRPALLDRCANPFCHSGWLRPWRRRTVPVFEQGWTCSMECTATRLRAAVAREMEGRMSKGPVHRHRIPLGLLMLEQGWITREQLRNALEAQKTAGTGRLGQWLVRQRATTEDRVARALGLQWSSPVLCPEAHETATLAAVMPRLFVDAFGALPLRLAADKVFYLGFEESLDLTLALAVEQMSGLRVECGIVRESLFRPAHARVLNARFSSVELVEAVSQAAAAQVLSRSIERAKPIASRLVRVHDCLWLRLWLRPQREPLPEIDSVQDVLCSIGAVE